jgi:hypothetical protein
MIFILNCKDNKIRHKMLFCVFDLINPPFALYNGFCIVAK